MPERRILLFEQTGYSDASTSQVYRYATGKFNTLPGDTPADTHYQVRSLNRIEISRTMFDGRSSGLKADPRSKVGYGSVVLANPDGAMDDLYSGAISFRERPFRALLVSPGASYSSAAVLLEGVTAQVALTSKDVTIFVKTRDEELDSPHLTQTFSGNNSLPNGLEGASDLQGKVKPIVYGRVFKVAPPQVNTSRLIHFLSLGALQSIDGVYEGGETKTAGIARSLAEMQAGSTSQTFTVATGTDVCTTGANHGWTTGQAVTVTTTTTLPAPLAINTYYYVRATAANTVTLHPTATDAVNNTNRIDITTAGTGTHTMTQNATIAGRYDWCFDATGSYLRLGSTPAYPITVDMSADTSGNSTAAQIIKQMALDRGIDSGDIASADVAALDGVNSAVLGIYVNDSSTTLSLMDQVARTVGAYYGFDRLGVLRMARFGYPTGPASAVIAPWNCQSLERVENGEDVPTLTMRLRYARYWSTQSRTDIAGVVSEATRNDLSQEWRVVEDTDTITPNPHKRTLEAERDTLFTLKADAITEAARLLTLTNAPRRTFVCRGVNLEDSTLLDLDIGDDVEIRWDRFGFDLVTGTLMKIIAISCDYALGRADITLWGA